MWENFEPSLKAVLAHEGGYVDHPSDPGGATNMGITRRTLAAWRGVSPYTRLPKSEVRNLSVGEAAEIYKANYWNRLAGDELPGGVDYATFDFGVNSGPARAAKFLQNVVGTDQDGIVGPVTVQTAWTLSPADVVNRLCDDRMAWLRRLRHWPTFGRGWTNRVEGGGGHVGVRPLALEMAARSPAVPPGSESPSPPEPPEAPSIEETLRAATTDQLIAELRTRPEIESSITIRRKLP